MQLAVNNDLTAIPCLCRYHAMAVEVIYAQGNLRRGWYCVSCRGWTPAIGRERKIDNIRKQHEPEYFWIPKNAQGQTSQWDAARQEAEQAPGVDWAHTLTQSGPEDWRKGMETEWINGGGE